MSKMVNFWIMYHLFLSVFHNHTRLPVSQKSIAKHQTRNLQNRQNVILLFLHSSSDMLAQYCLNLLWWFSLEITAFHWEQCTGSSLFHILICALFAWWMLSQVRLGQIRMSTNHVHVYRVMYPRSSDGGAAHPMPTKSFLHPIPNTTMLSSPCGWTHPPPAACPILSAKHNPSNNCKDIDRISDITSWKFHDESTRCQKYVVLSSNH